jgi:Flp pilus assembly protein TadD
LATVAGVILAVVLSRGDSAKPAAQVVKTVTAQGTTIRQTVTSAARTTAAATTAAAAPPPSGDGHSLNDQGYALMRRGDFRGALPLLQQAVQKLQGVGPADPYEGYANYNLGYTLLQLGDCGGAVTALERADQLEPHNKQVRDALKRTKHCG